MRAFDDHSIYEIEFPPKPKGTLQIQDVTCLQCNRLYRHYIQTEFGRIVSKPATFICSDCMNGFPFELRALREKLNELCYEVKHNMIQEEYLITMIQMTEQMLKWKK